MKRKPHQTLLALMIMGWVLQLGTPVAHAIPNWNFSLLPSGGDISGPAGSTIGWDYTITNLDTVNWLSLTGISADSFSNGTPDASVFDFPVVAPDSTVTLSYDGGFGLYQLTWDSSAPVGFVNSGTFVLSGEWYDGDPFSDGAFLDSAPDQSAAYSATVTNAGPTPVPEPSTGLLLASGIAGLGLLRKRNSCS